MKRKLIATNLKPQNQTRVKTKINQIKLGSCTKALTTPSVGKLIFFLVRKMMSSSLVRLLIFMVLVLVLEEVVRVASGR